VLLQSKGKAVIRLFHKPYGVLSQFKAHPGKRTLQEFDCLRGGRAVGRLDEDSEGLLVVTDQARWLTALTRPGKHFKTYWVQLEGDPQPEQLAPLETGIQLKDGLTAPARFRLLDDLQMSPRQPPIRERRQIPTRWLELSINEGRNRQVRRMTAALGFPTLRLIRVSIGSLKLASLPLGESRPPSRREQDWLDRL
jgi:23S rRNA pseudouridine2457 synthase